MPLKYASTIEAIKMAVAPDPLELGEVDKFFEETSDARDPHLVRRDEIFELFQPEDNVKVLLIGHAGAGKSTELIKFQKEHGDRFVFVSFSLIKEAQLSLASIDVLLVLIVESLVRTLHESFRVSLNEETLKAIYNWFAKSFDIEEKDLQYTGQIGASANTQDTFWGKLLGVGGFIKADIRTGAQTLHKTMKKEERRLSELACNCGLLIKEAQIAIRKELKKELVLIIEDLDKVPLAAADEIFVANPAPLVDLPCKIIYTAPIWLLYSPRASTLDAFFKKVKLPMIKVRESNGAECKEGREVIKKLIGKRFDISTLIEEKALELAIDKTGGVLRHIFEVLYRAAAVANQAVRRGARPEKKIIEGDVRYGLDQWRMELVSRIGTLGLPEAFKGITVADMYARLRELANCPRRLDSDPINILLLQAHAVIEYNGEGWHCIHPLIAEHLESMK